MSQTKSPTGKAEERKILRTPKNLMMNPTIAARGFAVAREMGFGAGEIVEHLLEKLWEERRKIPKRHRGDHLQITLFDRVTPPEELPAPEPRRKK